MLPGRTRLRSAGARGAPAGSWARSTWRATTVGAIGPGLLALVGVAAGDTADEAERLADKTVRLRMLAGPERPFDRALHGRARRRAALREPVHAAGGRAAGATGPSWSAAAPREDAAPLVDAYADAVAAAGRAASPAGASARTWPSSLENDGPVTVVLDSAPSLRAHARAEPAQASGPSPKGLPSESRQIVQRSPRWMTLAAERVDPRERPRRRRPRAK